MPDAITPETWARLEAELVTCDYHGKAVKAALLAQLRRHVEALEVAEAALRDVLYCAYKFDDKPHQLFYAVAKAAAMYESDADQRAEIVRLMEHAGDTIGSARSVWHPATSNDGSADPAEPVTPHDPGDDDDGHRNAVELGGLNPW